MKRILSIILSFVLAAGLFVLPQAEAKSLGTVSADEAIAVINMFDIGIDTAKIDMKAQTTRINFLVWALNVMGVRLENDVKEPVFKDIQPSTEAARYTEYAKNLKIVSGYEDGTFRPEKGITYIEAATMILAILNYREYAENNGGYPTGYRKLASDISLSAGIDKASGNEFLQNKDVMILFANLLSAPVITVEMDGNKIRYGISEDETVASRYYDADLVEGVVDGVTGTSFDGELDYVENVISIDGEVYDCTFDASDFLGKRVRAFVNEDEVCICAVPYRNNVLELNARDLVPGESSLTRIYYDNGGSRYLYAKLAELADVVCNKKGCPLYTLEQLLPKTGKITLIDNNDDGTYEVVLVNEYDIIRVNYVDTVNRKIFNKYTLGTAMPSLELPEDMEYTITKDGKECKLSGLRKNDILMVYKSVSDGETEYRIEVVNSTLSGTVKKIDYAEEEIYIDDEMYNISPIYIEIKNASDPEIKDISANDTVTVYFDSFGDVAAIERNDIENNRYGYLRKFIIDEADDANIAFRMLTTDEEWVTLKLRNKVKVNGQSRQSNNAIKDPELSHDMGVTAISQLLEYKVNAAGEITQINTASTNSKNYDKFRKKTINQIYRKNNRSFDSIYHITDDCSVFVVPDSSSAKAMDESLYSVYKSGYFEDWQTYKVDVYNYDKFGYSPLCTYVQNGDEIGNFSAKSFVFNKQSSMTENNEVYQTVEGAVGANCSVSVKMAEGVSSDSFERGAIYDLKLNNNSEIYDYTPIVTKAQIGTKLSKLDHGGIHDSATIMGFVTEADPYDGKLLIDDGYVKSGEKIYKSIAIDETTMLYTVNEDDRKNYITVGKSTDIGVGDYVIIAYAYSVATRIIVYKQ